MQIAEWDQLYRSGRRGVEQLAAPLVTKFTVGLQPGRALDLACGTGRHSIYLAQLGWEVTAVDGSQAALDILKQRADRAGVVVKTALADLERDDSILKAGAFDLILSCYYLERSLFPAILAGTGAEGMVIAIVHIPEGDEQANEKRAARGELRNVFTGWRILHDYEGPPHDPAHQRFVAEIVAKRISPCSAKISSTL